MIPELSCAKRVIVDTDILKTVWDVESKITKPLSRSSSLQKKMTKRNEFSKLTRIPSKVIPIKQSRVANKGAPTSLNHSFLQFPQSPKANPSPRQVICPHQAEQLPKFPPASRHIDTSLSVYLFFSLILNGIARQIKIVQ